MSGNRALSTDERFLCGFYMYPTSLVWEDFAEEQSSMGDPMTTADAWQYWIERMIEDGFNTFQIGVANNPRGASIPEDPENPYIEFFFKLSQKYNFNMIPHLESVYLKKEKDVLDNEGTEAYLKRLNEQITQGVVERAAECIREYKDHPDVLAFVVAEEPFCPEYMHWIMRYYDLIRKETGDVKFDLLFMSTREYMPLYLSDIHGQIPIIGTELYIFWWEFTGICHLAAPSTRSTGAFGGYVRKLKALGKHAREFNTHFKVVFTAASQESIIRFPQDIGVKLDKSEKKRILEYAEAGEHGWLCPWGGPTQPPLHLRRKLYLKYFRYYHPPHNCTRAMVWLAVMMGAKSIFQWALKPTPRMVREIIENDVPEESYLAWKRETGHNYWRVHILGLENKGTYMLKEYKDACQYLQKFGWLINRMEYDDGQDQGGWSNSTSPLEIADSDHFDKINIYSKSFSLLGYSGKIVVLVNGKVGTWCNKEPTLCLSPDAERYRIDKLGYVYKEDFTPDAEDLPIGVSLELSNDEGLWDLDSGECLISASGEIESIDVEPGGGKFLFIGPADEKTNIRRNCGLE
jgi:hypothetical protein